MKRASSLLNKLAAADGTLASGDLVCAAWSRAVGKRIAIHTRAAKLVRQNLVIEVEDSIWQRNLMSLSRQILANLEQSVGNGIVTELEFRIVPPRREPDRARTSAPATPPSCDDADLIVDPLLRSIYKASRHKETAA